MTYSVIIPTFNAESNLERVIAAARSSLQGAEIIVVDGGSSDQTVSIAETFSDRVILSEKGRGLQMNRGAAAAGGDIFLFLHADTTLPKQAQEILEKCFRDGHTQIGTFQMCFDQRHWLLNFYGTLTKIDSLWTRFGDQCIVVRRSFFESLGGYPNWPLFEDVRFLQEARRRTTIESFPAHVKTSAARFLKNGIICQQIKNGWLMLLYVSGVSPHVLSKKYSS